MKLLRPKDEPKASGGPSQNPAASGGKRQESGRRHEPAAPRRVAAGKAGAIGPSELQARRERLAAQFAELQWDLGGLVYEMAARDDFRPDVVARRAAKLQEVDAELAETERLLRLDEAGAAGTCPACGALYARGAVYCWHCGKELTAKGRVSPKPEPTPATETAAKATTPTPTPTPSTQTPPTPPTPQTPPTPTQGSAEK